MSAGVAAAMQPHSMHDFLVVNASSPAAPNLFNKATCSLSCRLLVYPLPDMLQVMLPINGWLCVCPVFSFVKVRTSYITPIESHGLLRFCSLSSVSHVSSLAQLLNRQCGYSLQCFRPLNFPKRLIELKRQRRASTWNELTRYRHFAC